MKERQSMFQHGKTQQIPDNFATDLSGWGRHSVAVGWKPDGSQAAVVTIVREIWCNINGRGDGLGDGVKYPVFHLFGFDTSRALSSGSGRRINPIKEPYFDYEQCLAAARSLVFEDQNDGLWVPVALIQA